MNFTTRKKPTKKDRKYKSKQLYDFILCVKKPTKKRFESIGVNNFKNNKPNK